MILREMVERFEKQAPACVMLRGLLENVFAEERLDALFERVAERQSNKDLLFSTVVDLMGLVAAKIRPSVNAAYLAKQEEVGVTVKALYDKLQRMETGVSQALVRDTASQMAAIIRQLHGERPELLPGYRTKILDGNHLQATQRRLKVFAELNAAPLPGHSLVVLDPSLQLAIDVFPCEDAYTQERALLDAVLETVQADDLWIADRNFCTSRFVWGLQRRGAFFVLREHANAAKWKWQAVDERKCIGRTETGMVYEQTLKLLGENGEETTVRRVTIELDQPTRDGDREIHVLTNLPADVSALRIVELYRDRWTIETAFYEISQNLNGEINALGYPKAALFAFCMGLVTFNLMSVIRASLRAAHGAKKVDEEVSLYRLCDEIAGTYRGQEIAVGERYWTQTYAHLTAAEMAAALLRIALTIDLKQYKKHKRSPKVAKPNLTKKNRPHVSTARVLNGPKKR
jgi:Transposase DDE domain